MTDEIMPTSEEDPADIGFKFAAKVGKVMDRYSENSDDEELFGTSPAVIALYMLLLTVFLPSGVITIVNLFDPQPAIWYSPLWMISNLSDLWKMFHPAVLLGTLWRTIPICSFNIVYFLYVSRFFQGKTSRARFLLRDVRSKRHSHLARLYVRLRYVPNS